MLRLVAVFTDLDTDAQKRTTTGGCPFHIGKLAGHCILLILRASTNLDFDKIGIPRRLRAAPAE